MERLSAAELAHLVEFLTASDLARVVQTCRALAPHEPSVQHAIARAVKLRFGDVAGFLREDDAHWPRSPLVLRCAEVLRVKQVLTTAVYSPEDATLASMRSAFVLSKAWTLAWKKRCAAYEQFLQQFRLTKKKQLQRERSAKNARRQWGFEVNGVGALERLVDAEMLVTRDASALIRCPHGGLLPQSFCVARAKRAVVSRSAYRTLSTYAPDVLAFPAYTTPDCIDCLHEKAETDRDQERKQQERFEEQIAGSAELVDVLLRKTGYPNELFSPATTRGNTLLSLQHTQQHAFFLVPKKWLIRWRKYVRSQGDDEPGPIFNAELVCHAHQRFIVPAYITMFLSGFSLEVSLQAAQALGASASTQYEIVTHGEWEALFDRYCVEYAVGFDIVGGSYHWKTPECHVCHYGMNTSQRRERRNTQAASRR